MKGCWRLVVFDHRRAIDEMGGRLSIEVAQLLGTGRVYGEAYYREWSKGLYQRIENEHTSDEVLSSGVVRGDGD